MKYRGPRHFQKIVGHLKPKFERRGGDWHTMEEIKAVPVKPDSLMRFRRLRDAEARSVKVLGRGAGFPFSAHMVMEGKEYQITQTMKRGNGVVVHLRANPGTHRIWRLTLGK